MLLFNAELVSTNNPLSDFNTSNVTIQLENLYIYSRKIHISIHLMLLFNVISFFYFIAFYIDFNTSNVTIQHYFFKVKYAFQIYFNTSNVTIQHIALTFFTFLTTISIHLMLLFNLQKVFNSHFMFNYFNTSNVTIQPGRKPIIATMARFQYI